MKLLGQLAIQTEFVNQTMQINLVWFGLYFFVNEVVGFYILSLDHYLM